MTSRDTYDMKQTEHLERTEAAGNVITTTIKHQEENKMENEMQVIDNLDKEFAHIVTLTVPVKVAIDALAKDEKFIDVVYEQMKESISDDVELLVKDNVESVVAYQIEDKMSDYLNSDNVWDTIESDVNNAITNAQDSEVTEEWIENQLDSYQGQNPANLCSLGKSVWNAICHTVNSDISLHLDKIQEGSVDLIKFPRLDTMVIDLVKLITTVSENVTKKVIEEEKQKYLANRDEYLKPKEDVVDAHLVDGREVDGFDPKLSVADVRDFINKLELSDNVKAYVRDEFINAVNQKILN